MALALITGGNRGIGLAVAQHLATRGWSLALVARTASRLEAACRALPSEHTAIPIVADLRDPAAPAAIIEQVVDRLGPIDLLVNNAGTAPSGRIEHTDDNTLDEVLDLHIKAPFRLIRAVLPAMRARGGGCLIQLASTAGLRGFPLTTGYAAAKHGMVGLTRALAAELQSTPIRTYAVCPGFVDTDITRNAAAKIAQRGRHTEADILRSYGSMNACGRLLRPDEIAAATAELAAPDCPYPSGSIYLLDAMPPTILEP